MRSQSIPKHELLKRKQEKIWSFHHRLRTENQNPSFALCMSERSREAKNAFLLHNRLSQHPFFPMDLPQECRICRDVTPPLLHACRCNTPVHAACLHRWLGYRADTNFPLLTPTRTECEVCKQPFHSTVKTPKTCENFISLEACLLLFLLVLAIMGHLIFVLGIYRGATREYSLQRSCLAFVNAVLTIGLLILVQKVVSRWLRESDFFVALASAPLASGDVETGVATTEERPRNSFVCQVFLGACLSIVAAAEIFFLLQQLPFASLA